jgi:hypothetical protein
VTVVGCVELHGAECIRSATALTIVSPARAHLRLDQQPLPTEWHPVGDAGAAWRAHVEVPLGPHTLELTTQGAAPKRTTLRLRDEARPAAVRQAAPLRHTDPAAARAQLEAALPSARPDERGDYLGALGRLAHDRRALPESHRLLREAVDAHLAADRVGRALRDAFALSYFFITDTADGAAAQATLALFHDRALGPDQRAYLTYFDALALYVVGDLRGAERVVAKVHPAIAPFGDTLRSLSVDALSQQAEVLQALGRHQEAIRQQAAAVATSTGCQRGRMTANLGWFRWLAADAQRLDHAQPDPPGVEAAYDEALRLLADCGQPSWLATIYLNRALAAVQRGDAATTRADLAAFSTHLPTPGLELRLWQLEIEARLLTVTGAHPAALSAWRTLAQIAQDVGAPQASWRAALGTAESLADLGQLDAAARAFGQADRQLDDQLLMVAGRGRETFLGDRERGTRRALAVLLDLERPAEALALARRVQIRLIRRLQRVDRIAGLSPATRAQWTQAMTRFGQARSRADTLAAQIWTAPKDQRAHLKATLAQARQAASAALDEAFDALAEHQPAEPRLTPEGTLLLTWHRLPQGWVAFAAEAQGPHSQTVRAVRMKGVAPEQLLAPFEAELARARQVAIIPTGALRDVAFHALPWRGKPLLAQVPVVYPLDLGPAPAASDGPALVIGDPDQSLPQAAAEARAVHQTLRARGPTQQLAGAQATPAAVLAALQRASHLHYAGHGEYGGLGGWDSALRLADRGRLTIGDILAAERVPATVVLSGCETGKSGRAHAGASVGLSQAFLAAGATAVLATDRTVQDALARAVAEALYARLPGRSLAQAAQQALLAVAAAQPEADWTAYRIWVR